MARSERVVVRGWMYWAMCLGVALACALVVGLGAPWPVSGPIVAAFLLLAPASFVLALARFHDPLISIVVALTVGPAVWSLVAAVEALTGWWQPRATVLGGCAVFALAGAIGLVSERRHRLG